jgi:mannose-6-phosphate isomerase-like protein (cupin superfamily)
MVATLNLLQCFSELNDYWSPRVVGKVNDQFVKVAKLLGELTWHEHEDEDELFQVIKGNLRIQIEGQADVNLSPNDFCIVPRGTRHNPIAEEECWIVLIETVTTKHTGDVITAQTRSIDDQLGAA